MGENMKLKFKQQKYQDDAAQSVVKCFEGQRNGTKVRLLDVINTNKKKGYEYYI